MTELIARLTPQSCQPIRLGGEHGLSAADVAHACTMSNEIGWLIIQIKFMGDLSGQSKLHKLLSERVMDEAVQNNWKKSRLPCLVKLAIDEFTGTCLWNDRERAQKLGVDPSGWCRVWKSKYTRLIEILEMHEQGTLHLARNRLR